MCRYASASHRSRLSLSIFLPSRSKQLLGKSSSCLRSDPCSCNSACETPVLSSPTGCHHEHGLGDQLPEKEGNLSYKEMRVGGRCTLAPRYKCGSNHLDSF